MPGASRSKQPARAAVLPFPRQGILSRRGPAAPFGPGARGLHRPRRGRGRRLRRLARDLAVRDPHDRGARRLARGGERGSRRARAARRLEPARTRRGHGHPPRRRPPGHPLGHLRPRLPAHPHGHGHARAPGGRPAARRRVVARLGTRPDHAPAHSRAAPRAGANLGHPPGRRLARSHAVGRERVERGRGGRTARPGAVPGPRRPRWRRRTARSPSTCAPGSPSSSATRPT